MLYLGWEILNAGALVLLVWAMFKAVAVLSRAWGRIKTGAFVLVLFGACQRRDSAATAPALERVASGNASYVANGTYSAVIEKHLTGKITLLISKGTIGKSDSVLTALPVVSGLLLGHQWEPFGSGIYRFENGKLTYNIAEILHWNPLGMNVFTQVKELQGTTALR